MFNKWIEIDAEVTRRNLSAIRSHLKEHTALMAVMKNQAYGHGLTETAEFLQKEGVSHWAVTWVEEGLALRRAGISGEILLLAPVAPEEIESAITGQLTLTAASLEDLHLIGDAAQKLQETACVHLKIETGLSRFGFLHKEILVQAAEKLRDCSRIKVTGAFTHMADAADEAFTQKQFAAFLQAVDVLKNAGLELPCLHCANSGVFLKYPQMQLDMVRIGTLLCGQYPAGNYPHPLNLQEPWHYKTRIRSIKKLPAGSFLGYKRTAKLKNPAQIAVIPVGYSDGLALTVNNRAEGFVDLCKRIVKLILTQLGMNRFQLKVKIKGHGYPVRGKVFMQMALVELPSSLTVHPGDEVEVPISKTLAGETVPRVYVETDMGSMWQTKPE